jgi:hypothetical protein
LIRRIETSRSGLGGHVVELKRSLDVPLRIKNSVSSRPLAWFGGSLGLGLVASRLLRRKPRKTRKTRMTAFMFTAILSLLKPALKGMLISELQRRFKVHTTGQEAGEETQLPLSKQPSPPSN